ncbi:MAG: bifunctional adenosylcobinamide kinase/adenosylcobinamide-phosphate guanylyltransferase [Leptolyngbya sp. SIO1D8]|nr:bifunctional adenosylcobinamide kinase/adenosylcobinamide-phosphate guanylyltransferase [Leptolyngbya sp. SIO1D8]
MCTAVSKRILVTGPTRSGKSEWAEWLAIQSQQPVIYVATAQKRTDDLEWQARIAAHCQRRPQAWRTQEVPVELAVALRTAQAGECWLVDSLGTWLANCLEQSDVEWQVTVEQLLATIASISGTLILVAEETGWGVVPAYPLGRSFRDRLGYLTRRLGTLVDITYLVVAGYAVDLSTIGSPVPFLPENPISQNITTS